MRRIIIALAALVLAALPLAAQNNPYALDDECYALFQEAEDLVGTEEFDAVNEEFLRVAREKGDTKSEVLYYVERLKHVLHAYDLLTKMQDTAIAEKEFVADLERTISRNNLSRLSELDVSMGKATLSADLKESQERTRRIHSWLIIMVFVLMTMGLLFALLSIRRLKKTNEKVRQADAAKTRFVQNMSHEVRTPLNAIVGFSQLLSLPDGTLQPEEKDEFVGHIVNNTKMLTMLLDDILNASAMDKGEYRIRYEEGELHYMCQAAMSSTEHRLQPGVTLTYEPESPDAHTFYTDPRRLQQILINLLSNSCKHTTQGSIVLRSSLTQNPGMVTFTVTDTGTGVPPEQAEAIFDRFTKLNEFVQGTGLGLSICRDITTRMGGKVYLDTTYKEGGARFIFMVPDLHELPLEQNP